jgi:hypothetical protein
MLGPQFRERAAGVREGAVQQHQRRPVAGGNLRQRRPPLQRRQGVGVELVDAGIDLRVDALHDAGRDQIRRRILRQAGEDLDGGQDDVAQPAARRRAAIEPDPA